ncbi:CARDB protein [Abditibacterium utsteinense]|uniref:CARDB protein n=1 Tax=Abditibacterium utsteinense TaxID=1960156 RepID=A0A2S8SP45_9BACT|nr:CARDB domain-containing protein [Abditibacterium utsteinense]PQV62572.1 CARDB protein [Abditibacterium utsteinense]
MKFAFLSLFLLGGALVQVAQAAPVLTARARWSDNEMPDGHFFRAWKMPTQLRVRHSGNGLRPRDLFQASFDVRDEAIAPRFFPISFQLSPNMVAPAPPSEITAKTTATSVVLSWKASPDAGVAGYFVSRYGRNIGRVTGTTFAEEKLDPGTAYPFVLRAFDGAGNLSQPVEMVATTETAFPDLVVSDIQLTQSESEIGDESHLLVKVENIGNAPTSLGTTVGVVFSVDGKVVAWSDTFRYTIAAGDFAILRTNNGPDGKGTWKVAAGTHELRAIVDDVNRIKESKETNNIANLVLNK